MPALLSYQPTSAEVDLFSSCGLAGNYERMNIAGYWLIPSDRWTLAQSSVTIQIGAKASPRADREPALNHTRANLKILNHR